MNHSRLLMSFALFFLFASTFGQTYPVSEIPDSLKANAFIVVRSYTREWELHTVNSGVEKVTKILTIFNKKGEDMAYLYLPYDKNSSVRINEITYYDSDGKKIRSVKQSEINDSPAYSNALLYSDARMKYYIPGQPAYPYTIKYDYQTDGDNIISYGFWCPFTNYNTSAQYCRLTAIYPENIKINRKEVGITSGQLKKEGGKCFEQWELKNIKAIESEPFDVSLREMVQGVYLMPSVLKYNNYEGIADNWKDYGKWIYSLYNGRDELPEAQKHKIDSILNQVPDTLQRIKILYNYLQHNTRYVAITLGLGGFQPFDARTVSETGYGDCKALSNYMHSLLKYAGIKSYPALVSSGTYKEPIFNDFPNFHQFDHVILCVPLKKDTTWLECTSQKIPFGFLGDFTDDRDVLLITENGGKFAHTEKYGVTENIRSCKSEFNLDSTGTAVCTVNTIYRGLQYYDIFDFLRGNYDEQKKWLYSNSTLPSLQLKSFSLNDLGGNLPCARLNESAVTKNYCSFSGKYMLLPLNTLNAQKSIQKMLRNRNSHILISRSSVDYDTVVFKLPKRFIAESLPPGITINSKFGNYSCSISATTDEIIFIRKFIIEEGRYDPKYYKEFYDFILSVSKADNAKVLLVRKT